MVFTLLKRVDCWGMSIEIQWKTDLGYKNRIDKNRNTKIEWKLIEWEKNRMHYIYRVYNFRMKKNRKLQKSNKKNIDPTKIDFKILKILKNDLSKLNLIKWMFSAS